MRAWQSLERCGTNSCRAAIPRLDPSHLHVAPSLTWRIYIYEIANAKNNERYVKSNELGGKFKAEAVVPTPNVPGGDTDFCPRKY